MSLAELAILFKLDTIGIVLLVLIGIVIPLLANGASKSDLVPIGAFSHVSLRLYAQPYPRSKK